MTRIVPSTTAEFKSEKCKAVEAKEVGRLRGIKVWLEETVREWASVCKDDDFDDAMSGRIFVIMGEKGSEMPDAKDKEIKARAVFEGSRIFTKSGRPAAELYQEIASSPSTMVSTRASLAVSALTGGEATLCDAEQAYVQSSIRGPGRPSCWVRLPKAWWPKSWFDANGQPLYRDPVVLLDKALYGHPESGPLWDKHLGGILKNESWTAIDCVPGVWHHKELCGILVVYVDDLMLV